MTTDELRAMNANQLVATAYSLANALPPLAHLAIAAGAPPNLVRQSTGCAVTSTTRFKTQTAINLIDRVNEALVATGCIPPIDIRMHSSATVGQSLKGADRQIFADEVIEMANALQRMKYAVLFEIDSRDTTHAGDLLTPADWNTWVQPRVDDMARLSDLLAEQAQIFARTRAQYVHLCKTPQVSWFSRRTTEKSLMISKLAIADSLEMLAASARLAYRDASRFEAGLGPKAQRQLVASWKRHAERLHDHRAIMWHSSIFRRTLPTKHPLIEVLQSRSQLSQSRNDLQASYQRALHALERFMNHTQSVGLAAASAHQALLSNRARSDTNPTWSVCLEYGRLIEIRTPSERAESSLLSNIPVITVTTR
ncbi:hypothetical protein [Mycobacterium sp. ACS4331]|uniref:hypothetical protein n=1 Tax=Mycobacterium sp. ACS4331 TaxID=1834121 RepID=UPI0012FBEBB2|nr:hypothetical protein [Mycobacterium sp. ACS4331]